MRILPIVGLVVVALVASACPAGSGGLNLSGTSEAGRVAQVSQATASTGEGEYIVLFRAANGLPAGVEQMIARAGGTVVRLLPQIGVAVTRSNRTDFDTLLQRESSVGRVVRDLDVQWIPGELQSTVHDEAPSPQSVADPTAARLYRFQWNMRSIQADRAWAAGHLGNPRVKVAILDTGIDYRHVDLAGKVNLPLSRSFVPDDPVPAGAHEIADLHMHGTHVAGIVASNAVGTASVAPNVTLIGVKVLNQFGSGTFAAVISGIVHAADVGADIINMSLGARFPRSCWFVDNGERVHLQPACAALLSALNRATNYAHSKGALVIAAAGNDATNADRDRDTIIVPAQSPNVVAVSAMGPINEIGIEPDTVASYTDFGFSLVHVGAPGGDFRRFPALGWWRDMVLSPCSTFSLRIPACRAAHIYVWAAGTSMAAPHAAGVAALIDSLAGGGMSGAQLRARLEQSADDLGKPGRDAFYGRGRVNAFNATR